MCWVHTIYILSGERSMKWYLNQRAEKTDWPWIRTRNILITFLKGTLFPSLSWTICLQFKITWKIHANPSVSVCRRPVVSGSGQLSRFTPEANSSHKPKFNSWLSSWCSIHSPLHKDTDAASGIWDSPGLCHAALPPRSGLSSQQQPLAADIFTQLTHLTFFLQRWHVFWIIKKLRQV